MPERRDIVLARVFFSDSPESKVRPAIVLSDGSFHKSDFVLVAAITTSNDEYCIRIAEKDANCPLAEGSSARFDAVIKLHSKQVVRRIGKVTQDFHSILVGKIIGLIK